MIITRASSTVSKRGPANYFSGVVWLNEITSAPYSSDVRALMVIFEPGARTAWHTHPHGQMIQIVSGVGRVQKAGESVVDVLPGDVVWFEPGERHWHGAAPNQTMSHLAIQRADSDGKTATWLELVTDTEYSSCES
jgi:quercetin dioxygenase-like cupin family protein